MCERNPNRCTKCLRETVLYVGECFACPLAETAYDANIQAEKVLEETKTRHDRRIASKICVQLRLWVYMVHVITN